MYISHISLVWNIPNIIIIRTTNIKIEGTLIRFTLFVNDYFILISTSLSAIRYLHTMKRIIMTMTMTMKICIFHNNHLNTMIGKIKPKTNNVVNEQETIQNNIECRYRRPTIKCILI